MSVNVPLLIVLGGIIACGAYLLMDRSLIKMLLGLMLVGNAVNVMILVIAGNSGNPPIRGQEVAGRTEDADPLAQAMILTAIVIMMGVAAFVLALVYRLFVLNRDDDDVEDDPEDLKILTGSLETAGDRDRSDDPLTLADTVAGDLFDDQGHPLTPEEFEELHRTVIETDLLVADDDDVVDELHAPDEDEDDAESPASEPGERGTDQ
ncbi:Na(+)/H(+) antiporter subunit C [Gordonia araii NBRC 100433]|uniref:Na(+)/H(+) antiporter subunit C n=1 Tax=Gordonia araii NBRC 100433 TaxID=1073574 RepID=G7GXX9_9ACTN|nr:Na(+)/H(+) antiporter subunit C [Gordonia araii]NNG98066.1 Na(+)/H(+) antiporter subunit C [Gordonia araii NBRC 100433]GAB08454.1 Na(+)/H(+) antiporter subunit C [Gordonia araii NBRC 100433]